MPTYGSRILRVAVVHFHVCRTIRSFVKVLKLIYCINVIIFFLFTFSNTQTVYISSSPQRKKPQKLVYNNIIMNITQSWTKPAPGPLNISGFLNSELQRENLCTRRKNCGEFKKVVESSYNSI